MNKYIDLNDWHVYRLKTLGIQRIRRQKMFLHFTKCVNRAGHSLRMMRTYPCHCFLSLSSSGFLKLNKRISIAEKGKIRWAILVNLIGQDCIAFLLTNMTENKLGNKDHTH